MGDFFFSSFIGVGSSKWVLKIFWGGLRKDNSLPGNLLAHTGDDCRVHYFYHIMLRCHKVMQLELEGTFKSWSDWLKVMAPGSNKFLTAHLLSFLFKFVLSWCETLPQEREILNKRLIFLTSLVAMLLFVTEPGSVGTLDSSICSEKALDRYTSTACYHRKVTSSLDTCHRLSKDLSVCLCVCVWACVCEGEREEETSKFCCN